MVELCFATIAVVADCSRLCLLTLDFQGIPGFLEQFTTFQVFCCLRFKLVKVRRYHQKQNKDTCTKLMLKVL